MLARRSALLPPSVLENIRHKYTETWSADKTVPIQWGRSFPDQIEDCSVRERDGSVTELLDILPGRIEAVLDTGRPYTIVDIGCGAFARLHTGLFGTDGMYNDNPDPDKPPPAYAHRHGLMDEIQSWGYLPGRDVMFVSVNGGAIHVPPQPGLQLISGTNIYDGIPDIADGSVDLLTAFNTVYQNPGGVFLLEYFDRLLARGKTPGLGIVNPFSHNKVAFTDASGSRIAVRTVMSLRAINYDQKHDSLSWSAAPDHIVFPVRPKLFRVCIMTFPPRFLVYEVDDAALSTYARAGGTVEFHPESRPLSENTDLPEATYIRF